MREREITNYPFMRNSLAEQYGNKIIPFPGVFLHEPHKSRRKPSLDFPGMLHKVLEKNHYVHGLILAKPGDKLPESVPDFRPYLQRDGLILLSWDKRLCEKGTLYTAYWVTSSGILRYYASLALHIEDFSRAVPNRKSYAAEDGIDFYGETGPDYIVHVAPELMMSSNQKLSQRPEHIKILRALGIDVNFEYPFLLTTERKKRLPKRRNKRHA